MPMSDFEASAASIAGPRSCQSNAALPLGVVIAGTLSLGFLEACLHIERRPIPLRFATTFAVANALPSTVWQSIAPRHVAAALRVPLKRVVGCNTTSSSLSSRERSTRIILLKTTRCLRYGLASYGLAWSLYTLAHTEEERAPDTVESQQELRPERVLRLAPVDSLLSVTSLAKHGAKHITLVPDHKASRSIDWSTVGLHAGTAESSDRLLVVEMEVNKPSVFPHTPQMLQDAKQSHQGSMLTVAVLSGSATTPFLAGADVCFSAMSGILQSVSDLCQHQQVDHALLYLEDAAADGFAASDLSHALLYQCGIKSSSLDEQQSVDTQSVYVIVAKTAAAGQSMAKQLIQRDVPQSKICVLVQESLRSVRWRDERIARFSSSDFCDEVLQQTRELVRSGHSAAEIQMVIYQQYGMQQALGQRSDQYSDITKYI